MFKPLSSDSVLDVSQTQEHMCSATISNYYITPRERFFNQTTRLLLSAFFDNPLGTETDVYQQLLMDLGLDDTPDREETFDRAFSQIIAANTRACMEYQGENVTTMNLIRVVSELRNALDSGSDLNSVREIFGRALCLQSLVEAGSGLSFVTELSGEDRGKISGLAQIPYSLGFVIDDTGSMAEEIARVQEIIHSFVNSDVGAPTHYILTSFNDPSKWTLANDIRYTGTLLSNLTSYYSVEQPVVMRCMYICIGVVESVPSQATIFFNLYLSFSVLQLLEWQ